MEPDAQQAIETTTLSMIKDIQNDMMYFKDEVLRDMRKLELQTKGHTDRKSSELDKRLIGMETLITKLTVKINSYSTTMSENTHKIEKIDQLSKTIISLEERLNIDEIQLSTGLRELSEYSFKFEKLLTNNLIVPGLIGERFKYPNLKEYIFWLNTQIGSFNNFKEKQTLDLKSYKEKLENNFNIFNNAIERIKANFIENCKESVVDCQKFFNERIKSTEQLIASMQIENNTYSINIKNDLNTFRDELKKIKSLRDELNNKYEKEIGLFKQESSRNIGKCTKFQKEYKMMKGKFIELSDFIKDVRFRANLGGSLNRREFLRMSHKINFRKKKKILPEHILLKSLDTELFHNEKEDDLSVSQRRDTKSATDLMAHKPDFFDKLTHDEIKLFSLDRERNKNKKSEMDSYLPNRGFNNKTISLLKTTYQFQTDEQKYPNRQSNKIDEKEIMRCSCRNDNKVSRHDSPRIGDQQDNSDSHKDKSDRKITDISQIIDKSNINIKLSQKKILKMKDKASHSIANDNTQLIYKQDNNDKALDSSYNAKKQFQSSSQITIKQYNDEINQRQQKQQVMIADVFSKLSATQSKILYLEHETNKKIESIHHQFKRFFSQFMNDDKCSGKLRILKYPSGIFVPSSFDDKNLDNYFPDNKKNLSTKSRTNQKQTYKNEYDRLLID